MVQYKMCDIDAKDGKSSRWVAKFYKQRVETSVIYEDARLSMIAQTYADDFNRKSGISQTVAFLPSYVLELVERRGQLCCVEPVLQGEYTKHNNNDGVVATRRMIPQAFSHFTYESSHRELLVCDIQGTLLLRSAISRMSLLIESCLYAIFKVRCCFVQLLHV